MKTNKPYIYYILLSFSVVGIEITYAVPYYVKIYHFSFWEWSLLSMTVGPFIGFVVQPLVGWLGDNNVLGLGKRRPFIVVGVFIWIIGSFLTLICGGYALQFQLDNNAQGKDYELYFGVNTIMDIMFCVSLIINYVGLNTIQVSSRAIILDLVAVKEQYKAELMSTAVSGIGKLLYCVVNIMVYFTNNDNTNVMLIIVYIMIIMCMVIIPVSSSVTLFAAIEEEKYLKIIQFTFQRITFIL
ncbi:Sucrose transporter [Entamoeba marina]